MEQAVHSPVSEADANIAGLDMEHLRAWYQEYLTEDSECYQESIPSKAQEVESDPIDAVYIKYQIQLSSSTTQVSKGFCGQCRHLLNHWPHFEFPTIAKGKTYIVHNEHPALKVNSTYAMEAAAQQGCMFCAFLFYRLKELRLLGLFRRIEKRFELLNEVALIHLFTEATIFKQEKREIYRLQLGFPGIANWRKRNAVQHLRADFVDHTEIPFEDMIDDSEILKNWLHTCQNHHEPCNITPGGHNESEHPKRLVHIANNAVKLIQTNHWKTLPPYATLSYCWGGIDFIKTTKDNLESFHNHIPFKALPKTFQDAISLARGLGLDFIWIDALCIIQAKDNEHADDWYQQSGRMRYIYGRSHLNIAASTGKNPNEGLYVAPQDYCHSFITAVTSNKASGAVRFSNNSHRGGGVGDILGKRAWAFQERLLAPRTIHLTHRGLFWECRCSVASKFLSNNETEVNGLVQPENTAWQWYQIISAYSNGRLTNPKDKLPALSGVAKRQQEATGHTYVAGLWRETLKKSLLWKPLGNAKRLDPRIPTWSWTCLDVNILSVPMDISHAEVLDAWTTPTGQDPFGEVEGGEIRLRCAGMVRGRYLGKGEVVLDTSTQKFPISMDCPEDDNIGSNNFVWFLPLVIGNNRVGTKEGTPATRPDVRNVYEEIKTHGKRVENSSGELVIEHGSATIELREGVEHVFQKNLNAVGLILQPSGSLSKGQFRRIGRYLFHYGLTASIAESMGVVKTDHYHEFLGIVNEVGAKTAESECTELWVSPDQTAKHEDDFKTRDSIGDDKRTESWSKRNQRLKAGAERSEFAPDSVHPDARYVITIV